MIICLSIKSTGLPTSRDALRSYTEIAEDSYMLYSIPLFSKSLKEREWTRMDCYAFISRRSTGGSKEIYVFNVVQKVGPVFNRTIPIASDHPPCNGGYTLLRCPKYVRRYAVNETGHSRWNRNLQVYRHKLQAHHITSSEHDIFHWGSYYTIRMSGSELNSLRFHNIYTHILTFRHLHKAHGFCLRDFFCMKEPLNSVLNSLKFHNTCNILYSSDFPLLVVILSTSCFYARFFARQSPRIDVEISSPLREVVNHLKFPHQWIK